MQNFFLLLSNLQANLEKINQIKLSKYLKDSQFASDLKILFLYMFLFVQ